MSRLPIVPIEHWSKCVVILHQKHSKVCTPTGVKQLCIAVRPHDKNFWLFSWRVDRLRGPTSIRTPCSDHTPLSTVLYFVALNFFLELVWGVQKFKLRITHVKCECEMWNVCRGNLSMFILAILVERTFLSPHSLANFLTHWTLPKLSQEQYVRIHQPSILSQSSHKPAVFTGLCLVETATPQQWCMHVRWETSNRNCSMNLMVTQAK